MVHNNWYKPDVIKLLNPRVERAEVGSAEVLLSANIHFSHVVLSGWCQGPVLNVEQESQYKPSMICNEHEVFKLFTHSLLWRQTV